MFCTAPSICSTVSSIYSTVPSYVCPSMLFSFSIILLLSLFFVDIYCLGRASQDEDAAEKKEKVVVKEPQGKKGITNMHETSFTFHLLNVLFIFTFLVVYIAMHCTALSAPAEKKNTKGAGGSWKTW